MDVPTDLTITVKVDTALARQEVYNFQQYALRVLEEVRAAYAALGTVAPSGGQPMADDTGINLSGTSRRA